MSPQEEVEEWRVECGVCYTYRLGEELPATACEDSRYHVSRITWIVSPLH